MDTNTSMADKDAEYILFYTVLNINHRESTLISSPVGTGLYHYCL